MPRFRNLNTFVVLFVLCVLALPAHAQSVILYLRNGDRLSGSIINETDDQIVISTSWNRELAIPFSEITSREEIVETAPSLPSPIQTPSPAPTPVATTDELLILDAERKEAGFKFAPNEAWHGKIDLGIDLIFGERSRELFYGKAKIVYAPAELPDQVLSIASRFRNTFEYQVSYGKTEGILSDNRMDGLIKPEFDIGRRVFVYTLLGVGYDEVRLVDYQYEVGPGLGYRLIKTKDLQLNTEVGFDYQFQALSGNQEDERFSIRLAEDSKWTLNDRFVLDEKVEFFPGVESSLEFRLRFEANLRYKLWKFVWLTLSVMDLYDTKVAEGVNRNELQLRSLLGVDF